MCSSMGSVDLETLELKHDEAQPQVPAEILRDVRELITIARRQSAVAVNMGLTVLYWRIGKRLPEITHSEQRLGRSGVLSSSVATQGRPWK
jgi:hypothetical protein